MEIFAHFTVIRYDVESKFSRNTGNQVKKYFDKCQ